VGYITGCYWHWWCIQECRVSQPSHSRIWREDYQASRANSWPQHKDRFFLRSRWMENCEFSFLSISVC